MKNYDYLQLNYKTIFIDNWILSFTTYAKWQPLGIGYLDYFSCSKSLLSI